MKAAGSPQVAVVVVTFDSEATIEACLRSIAPAEAAQVVVVDNASGDRSVEAARAALPGAELIASSTNEGFGRGVNRGIEATSAPYILVLNPDAVLQPGALPEIVRFAEEHPKAGLVGPRLLNADGSLQHSCFKLPSLRMAFYGFFPLVPLDSSANGRYLSSEYERPHPVEHLLGACVLVRRAAIDAVGPMDESFWMYFEETDWCRRMLMSGWQVLYTPSATVVHLGAHSTSREPERMSAAFHHSQARYFRKHHGWLGYLALKMITLAGVLFWLARSARARVRGRIDAQTFRRRLDSYWRIAIA